MLRKFRVKNFLSFRDWQTLDLTVAANAPDLPGRFVQSVPGSKDRFPTFVAIFGANASGKTNILQALTIWARIVQFSHRNQPNELLPPIPFLGIGTREETSEFEAELDAPFGNSEQFVKFHYRLVISPDQRRILEEDFRYFPKNKSRKLFSRREQIFKFGDDFGLHRNDLTIGKIRPNSSAISILAQFNHPICLNFVNYLSFFQSNVAEILDDQKKSITDASNLYSQTPTALANFVEISKKFDIGIEDVKISEISKKLEPVFYHRGTNTPFPYALESHGTKKIFTLFPKLFSAIVLGGVVILDEFDNSIHSLLLPEFIDYFVDLERNPKHAQLITACHSPTILQNLEKEEVFFTEKGNDGATEIYGLKDIKGVRRESNIYANYLAGAFGGVPKVA